VAAQLIVIHQAQFSAVLLAETSATQTIPTVLAVLFVTMVLEQDHVAQRPTVAT
jgi:nitrate reductase NapAB chaperone NapD